MKKLKKFILVVVLLLGVSSCSKSPINIKIDPRLETYVEIDQPALQEKMNNREDLVLYIYSDVCLGCKEFKPILEKYIKEHETVIYAINTKNLPKENNLVKWNTTPSLALINDGKSQDVLDGYDDSSKFASYENISSYLNSNITLNYANIDITSPDEELKDYSISTYLDEMIANKETFIIHYYFESCSDCIYFERMFLEDFNNDNPNLRYYAVEVGYYFEHPDIYYNFTEKYGLSSEVNAEFGYKKGVVPMFQYYENGEIKDSLVIFNDYYEKKYDEDEILTEITITDSFYKDAPFIGKTYTSTMTETPMAAYRSDTLEFYIGKFKEFMTHIQ